MEANKIRLLEFIGSSKRTFNIPVYQRNYDWKEEHCKRLFLDIEHIASSNFEVDHFLGTIVYVIGSTQPNFMEFIVIDGQQRITSVMLLIKALYDKIEDTELKEDILETYLINKRAPQTLRLKLKPIESDMLAYEKIIENENIADSSNIIKNYNLFKQLVDKSSYSAESLYNALNNIEIVYIALDKDKKSENPQLIFESLNSTGLTLTQADLIRNFLLMNHEYEEQKRLYKNYWSKIEGYLPNAIISDFVRDYLTMKSGLIPKKDKVYKSFKEFVNENINYNEEQILEELLIYAEYYSWLINCNSPNKMLNELLQQLQQMKSTVTYPAMLYIFEDCFAYKKITVDNLIEIIRIILSYLYRRLICEYPTNALNKIFATLSSELEKLVLTDETYYDAVVKILASKSGSGTFPRNEEFRRAFILKDLYKTKIDKYTLFQLEKYNNKEVVDLNGEITVEHIMPQKLSPSWQIDLGKRYEEIHKEFLHTIGNLTLSGYNPKLSNKRFYDKKEILINSNISISRDLTKYSIWNEETIKDRAEYLFKIATLIWNLPEKYNYAIDVDKIDYDIDYNIMDDLNVTGEKPRQLIILDMEYNVNSWKDVLREICRKLYELDAQIFESFVKHKDFEGRERRIISNSSDGMNSPFKLTEKIYIETTLNANAILNYCKLIVEKYDMQNDIFFRLRP
ncbi:DUF262 domain-containing HNH endonuclease family protein [Alkaliphilus sp. MSJ-5]|uniref:DUF262 domain-containing HNH endonuclease family protein n=1 Tax=Alkaliphilus flagellatus TaxID=2841507 RepID=A0ABS6G539_9FIRM|nr:DUF262 domain-containing protein [Alkaliphilus flagellatus]MBU5676817.1 DUF262 domain-containing HNH endonuclease family protein [Alkaliphilus flagellatus]